MDETQIGPHEPAFPGAEPAGGIGGGENVAGDDLLHQGPWPRLDVARDRKCGAKPGAAIAQQPAMAKNGGGQFLPARHQFLDADRLALLQPRDQREIGGREQTQIIGVLPIDAFEALGDNQPDAGHLFRQRTVLARRALAIAAAGDGDGKTAPANGIDADRAAIPGLDAGIGMAAKPVVKEDQRGQRGDLVGRHIVAQQARIAQRLTSKLRLDPRRIGGQKQDAAADANRLRRLPRAHPPCSGYPTAASTESQICATASSVRSGCSGSARMRVARSSETGSGAPSWLSR